MFLSALRVLPVLLLSSVTADTTTSHLKTLSKSLDKCGRSQDWGTCLRLTVVSLLDDAIDSKDTVVINDFVSLSHDPKTSINDTAQSEKDIEKALIDQPDKKEDLLNGMIVDRMSRYLGSRSLHFTVPADLSAETGRKKDKKGNMMMMAAMAMGAMMMQLVMGKIALLAGKALLIAKMALLLSAVIALKKLLGGGGGESHPQVIYASESHGGGGGHSSGWGRSMTDNLNEEEANKLAYSGWNPTKPITGSLGIVH